MTNPRQAITAYFRALASKNVELALTQVSESSLFLSGSNHQAFQEYLEDLIHNQAWQMIDLQIVEERPLTPTVTLVHTILITQTKNEGTGTFDRWMAATLEEGQWRFNVNNIVDGIQLGNSTSTYKSVTISFNWLVRYTNGMTLFISVANNGETDVLWGGEGELLSRFIFDDHMREATGWYQFAAGSFTNPAPTGIEGWFEKYPQKIELQNWKFTNDAETQSQTQQAIEYRIFTIDVSQLVQQHETFISPQASQITQNPDQERRKRNKLQKQQWRRERRAELLNNLRKFAVRLIFLAAVIGVGWIAFSAIRNRVRPSSYIESNILAPVCTNLPDNTPTEGAISGNSTVFYEGRERNVTAVELGLDEAEDVNSLDILICIQEKEDVVEVCQYERTATTITRIAHNWEVTVVNWATKERMHHSNIVGYGPELCPNAIGSGDVFSRAHHGDVPVERTADWLADLEN